MANNKNVLVTGATGFVGQALVAALLTEKFAVSALVRTEGADLPSGTSKVIVPDLAALIDFQPMLKGIEVIIHVAGRAHIMNDIAANPLNEFRKVNTGATLRLAKQAAEAGVKRFIFLSSIKVNGEMTECHVHPHHHPEGGGVKGFFSESDEFIPSDPYGLSKYEAELGLLALAKETDLDVVIIRPPLVYGPGVRANFASMMYWINRGIPLPFGAINNKRSLVALDNLVDFIALCADIELSPKAANEVFLISDGEDVSTTQLLRKVAQAFAKKSYLIPVPVGLMTFVAKLIGKGDVANRLFGSLQVDSSKARDLLGWKPVIKMDEQLKKTAASFETRHDDAKV